MTTNQISLVQKSWQKILYDVPQTAQIFYITSFKIIPSLKALFPSDIVEQSKKLIAIFDTLVNLRDKPKTLILTGQELGIKYFKNCEQPGHYDTAVAALLKALAQRLGEDFTTLTQKAWFAVYQAQATTMINAVNNVATTQSQRELS